MQVPQPNWLLAIWLGGKKKEKKKFKEKKTLKLFYNEIIYCFKTNKKTTIQFVNSGLMRVIVVSHINKLQ